MSDELHRHTARSWIALWAAVATVYAAPPSRAANLWWDGTGAGWNSAASWSTVSNATTPNPLFPPGGLDTTIFNITSVNSTQTVNLNANQSALGLLFVSSGVVTIQGGGGANAIAIGANGITVNSGAGSDTIAAGVSLNGAQTWTNNSSLFTVSGLISGSGDLTKAGSGELILSNSNNSYSGATTISQGTLLAGAANVIPSNSAVVDNSTFNIGGFSQSIGSLTGTGSVTTIGAAGSNTLTIGGDNTSPAAFTGTISDASGGRTIVLTKVGTGTLTLGAGGAAGGNNSYSGGTNINGGTLALGSSGALGTTGTISFGGGTLQFSASNTTDYSSRFSGAASQAYSLDTDGQNITLASALTSSGGSLTKFGAGTLTLSASSSFTGSATVNGGTLELTNTGALTAAGTISIGTSSGQTAALTLDGGATSITQSGTVGIQVGNNTSGTSNLNIATVANGAAFSTGSGLLQILKTGSVNIGSGAITGSLNANGDVTIDGGVLTLSNTGSSFNWAASHTMTVQWGGKFSVTNSSFTLPAASVVNVSGSASQINIAGGNALLVGAGAQINVTSGAAVSTGVLDLGDNATAAGTAIFDGAGTNLTTTVAGQSLLGGLFGAGTGTLTFRNNAVWSSTGGLTIANGDGSSGTLNVQSGASVTTGLSITVASTVANASGTINLSGGNITQSGTTLLTVGASSTSTAAINVTGGTYNTSTNTSTINATGLLNIDGGTFNANGNFTLSGGRLTRNAGAFTLAAGKTMTIQNGGRASFTGDYVTANSTYNLSGAGSTLETLSSGNLRILGGGQVTVAAGSSLASSGLLDVGSLNGGGGGTLNVTGAGSSAVASSGTSTWGQFGNVANVSFSNGATGTFNSGVDLAAGASAGNHATLDVLSGATLSLGSLTLAANAAAGSSAVVNVNGGGSISQVLASTTTIGNSSTSSAVINIATGANGGTFTSGTGLFTINKTGSVTVGSGANIGALNVNGPITINSGGTLTVNSGSTATIAGAFTGTAISGGGQVSFQGDVNPGIGAANATFGGNVVLSSTAKLNIELGGTIPGTQSDHVSVSGQLAAGGTLAVSLINGFSPAPGQAFSIYNSSGLSGSFTSIQLPTMSPGLVWNTSQLYTAGQISVGQPGDYNNDNKVDAADYVTWRKSGGSQTDYNTWRVNFGANARTQGVDVSHFQGSTGIAQAAWNQMASEAKSFAFIKATEGLTGPDDAAMANNVAGAAAAGILNGVYHYAHAENRPTPAGAVSEADHFLNYAGAAIGPGHLRPVLDIEGSNSQLTAAALTDWVIAFINELVAMRGSSASPIIYTTPFFTNNKFDSRISNYDLWVADQSSSHDPQTGVPSTSDLGHFSNWSFWQYNVGTAGGISPIDLDVVHGEYKPLASFIIPASMSPAIGVPEPASAAVVLVAIAVLLPFRRVVANRRSRRGLDRVEGAHFVWRRNRGAKPASYALRWACHYASLTKRSDGNAAND